MAFLSHPLRWRDLGRFLAAAPIVLMVALLGGRPGAAMADDAQTLERRVKAAYLYKFAGYVEWPEPSVAPANGPIVIGVSGAEQVADELEKVVAGRTVRGRTLLIRRLDVNDPLNVHILFVGRRLDRAQAAELLSQAEGKPVLTVTEASPRLGGIINFVIVDEKVRFEISTQAAERNGLRLGSQLLAVGRPPSAETR